MHIHVYSSTERKCSRLQKHLLNGTYKGKKEKIIKFFYIYYTFNCWHVVDH